jgi:3',5'-cyclic AMP phosphodiesterase CpdA
MRKGTRFEGCSRREFLRRAAAAGFLVGGGVRWLGAELVPRTVSGLVLGAGVPLPGVRVSDGLRVTASDSLGRFSLDVGPESGPFIHVVTPRGFWTALFHVPTAQAAQEGRVEFRLDVRPQADKFRFVFMTDMHLEGGGPRLLKFRRSLEEMNALEPAFVWAGGDICLEGKAGKDYVEGLSVLKVPVRNGAGNHEMLVAETNPRDAYEAIFGPTYYSFDWAGVHCVVLDGNEVVSKEARWTSVEGRVSRRQLAWLEADLRARPAGMPVIAAIHIPLVSSRLLRAEVGPDETAAWVVQNAGEVRAILERHGARLVLQGHLHENERLSVGGIEYATTQALSGSWWANEKTVDGIERGTDGARRGYRVVEVDETSIRHEFRSSAESRIDAAGEVVPGSSRSPLFPRRNQTFVLDIHDPSPGAKVLGRVGDGPWVDAPPHPAVEPSWASILPHHHSVEVDARPLAGGKRVLSVEVEDEGRTSSFSFDFEVARPGSRRVPLIYCTDLYHPHIDPDDHFDLATIFALEEIDLRAIVLDDGAKQKERPGLVAVRQLEAITHRRVPVAVGLSRPLRSPKDDAKDDAKDWQAGVELILETLRKSPDPVAIVAVGSLRDVAAAFNREPYLVADKVDRIFAFIGDAHSTPGFAFREYNVMLDVQAYRRVLRSGLPVFWVPCFDGGAWQNAGRASFWRAKHRDLLSRVKSPLKQYFIHALEHRMPADPIAFLEEPVDEKSWEGVLAGERNLWCTAVFTAIADRALVRRDGRAGSVVPGGKVEGEPVEPFRFERTLVDIDPTGLTLYPGSVPRYPVHLFRVNDPASYPRTMTELTADILESLG